MSASIRLKSAAGALLLLSSLGGARAAEDAYAQHNLVSDGAVPADHTDPNLVNAWGIAFNPTAFAWVTANGTGKSTLYDGAGVPQSLVVTIPPPTGGTGTSAPTGIVFNATSSFVVRSGTASAAARFLFATEDGTVSGWAPSVDPTNAILAIDNSQGGSVFKGLALAGNGTEPLIYLTDFRNRKVAVFDGQFHQVQVPGGFIDLAVPHDFAPFGIQNVNGALYVTYAKQNAEGKDDVAGHGLGLVDVFDTAGNLVRRFAAGGPLNAPWGIALAPANFGRFSSRLLVGNFGDGAINAYDPATGAPVGQLRQANGQVLKVDGLWGIAFGNGFDGQATNALFFAAGPQDESHGLYGRIEAVEGSGHHGPP
jgi:uncharacterized protein (TIGR03118 family)